MITRRTFIRSGSLFVPTMFYVGHGQQAALWRRKIPATEAAAGGDITFKEYLALENQSASVTTVATGTFNIAAGDLVVAMVGGGWSVNTVTIGSDSLSRIRQINYSSSYYVELWAKSNASANASATLTATFNASAAYRHISGITYSGIATASAGDGSASNSAGDNALASASTNRTSQNITTTNANDLLIACHLNWDFDQVATEAVGWTKRSGSSSQMASFFEKIITSTGTHPSGNFATVPSSDEYLSFISAWKKA